MLTTPNRAPDYITLDEKGREEFLSDLGTFAPGERAFFHRLCRMWEPEIPYDRAAQLGPDSGAMAIQDLDRLLDKLRQKGYAVTLGSSQNGEFRKQKIILTSLRDERYYRYRVADEVQRIVESGSHALPSAERLEQSGLEIPDNVVTDIDFAELARIHAGKLPAADRVLRLKSADNKSYFLVAGHAKLFIGAVVEKVRYHCTNGALLEVLAKIRDSSLGEIRSMLGSGDPTSWLEITGILLEERRQIEAKRTVAVEPTLFEAAQLLREFIRSEIDEARARRQRQEEREADFQAIAEQVKHSKPPLVPVKDFTNLVLQLRQKYGDEFEAFSKEFYDAVLKPKEKRNLPVVLLVQNSYVHRDLVFALFQAQLSNIAKKLGEEYVQRMTYQIKHGRRNIDSAFLSRQAFDEDIMSRLQTVDPFIWELFQKPHLFAEALIHHHKRTSKKPALADLKLVLAEYLDIRAGEFLPLSHLLDLNMVSIFEGAFIRLPVWRQIFIRISGRYETVKSKYVGRTLQSTRTQSRNAVASRGSESGPVDVTELDADAAIGVDVQTTRSRDPGPPGRVSARPRGTNAFGNPVRASTSLRQGSPDRPAAGTTAATRRSQQAEAAAKRKQYTQQQRDTAWEEFSKILRSD